MRFDIITTFPQMVESPMNESILKRARETDKIQINVHDLRKWTHDKHRITDDYPYGGGPGMVMKVEPLAEAVDALREKNSGAKTALMTPQGNPLNQSMAKELADLPGLIIICGRYEGVDERVREHFCDMEISMGDFVLTGGEIPAMAVVDAVARLIPGVLGAEDSLSEESHSNGLLEYPHYTRPAEFRGLAVPEVLLSGHHANIVKWRKAQSIQRTAQRRPDLLEGADLTREEQEAANNFMNKSNDQT